MVQSQLLRSERTIIPLFFGPQAMEVCVCSEFVECVLWCKSSLWRFIGQKEWPSRLFTLYPVSPSQLAGARSDELSAR